MSYRFLPGQSYRMPTHFGPATGPRRGPNGEKFDCIDSPKTTAISASFLTQRDALDAMLPPGFELAGQPVITFTATYMKDIQWLAGRGYNMLGVSFMATYQGRSGDVTGSFLAVLWENLTEPIITGREELGYAKIFCDLPEPVMRDGSTTCKASWMGFDFFEMTFDAAQDTTGQASAPKHDAMTSQPASAGTLHYRYLPQVSTPGKAALEQVVLTPAHTPNRKVHSITQGRAQVKFHRARWEDMPTQYMIVNALADMPLLECVDATIAHSTGGKDLGDMQVLD